ncbi:MAG: hypothetical protein IT355_04950 [Gemmatimonadaceae bacterium]|nr:hypothetical protein [Gemmatimonadaceae bacterium]
MRPPRRPLVTLAAALVLWAGAAVPACAQGAVEPTLVDVRLGQVASLALRAERAGDRLWLPVAELAAGLELEVVSRSASRVELRRWPSRALIVLDRDSALVRLGTRVITPRIGALRVLDGELGVDAGTLQEVLQVSFEVSWADLMVSLPQVDSLPIGRRVAREKARAQLSARGAQQGATQSVAPLARPLAAGAVLDYSLSMPLLGERRELGWTAAGGVDVLGGSLEVSTGAVTGGTRLPTLASWTGVWRDGRKLTQLRLGDGLGGGPQPRLGRGLMLTNAPYARPALFGLQTLRGDLPPGWTIEAYRNGELVAVDTVGRGAGYQLQLPVLYGENPVDLLAVGPFGQTRALSQNLRIMSDLLPRDRAEYAGSLAQCRLRQQCLAAGTLDMRVGLTERWTMRVGADALARDTVGWRVAPYLSFVGAPRQSVAVQLDAAAQSRTRLALNIEPSQKLRLSMERQWFGEDPIDPLLAARRLAQTSLYAFWRRLDRRQTSVEASLDQTRFIVGGALLRARIGVGTQNSTWRLQPYVRHDQSSRAGFRQTALGLEATLLPDGSRGPYLGASLLRLLGEVDARGRAIREAVTLAMPLPGAFRVDGGVALQRGIRGPIATLSFSRDLNSLRSYTNATISNGASSVLQSVQGSALAAPGSRRPQFVTGPSLQRTGVTGIVYLDRNANGLRDAGEPVVPDVMVQVGTGFARSDADGRYRVWDLVPFVPLPVQVDSSSLPSPLWIPSVAHASLEAGPNRFEPLDIPLVAGGVLEGRVVWRRQGGVSLPPVPLLVTNAKGAVVARTESFSDGEFVLFGVRPGVLTVRVDPAWLVAQRAVADSQSITLAAQDDGAMARLAPLTIVQPGLEHECAAGSGAECGARDADLRESRGAEGVGLLEVHEQLVQRGVTGTKGERELAVPAVVGVPERLSAAACRRLTRAPGEHRDCALPAPLHTDPEHRVSRTGEHADRLKSERASLNRGGGRDRALLGAGGAGRSREQQERKARRRAVTAQGERHVRKSRQRDGCARGSLRRGASDAGPGAREGNCTVRSATPARPGRVRLPAPARAAPRRGVPSPQSVAGGRRPSMAERKIQRRRLRVAAVKSR